MDFDLATLQKRMRSTGIKQLCIGAVVGVLALGTAYAAWYLYGRMSTGRVIAVAAFALGFGYGAFAMVTDGLALLNPEKTRLVQALTSDPSSIGWIYRTVGSHTSLTVYFNDGKPTDIYVGEKEQEAALRFIAARAPNAVVGYSDEALAEFKRRSTLKR
jgi:hypothetical protein